jgi:hypothetical protein
MDVDSSPAVAKSRTHGGPSEIRRKPGIALLRTCFDIRPIFEDSREEIGPSPLERPVPLAISFEAGELGIFELAPEVFDLLGALGGWTAVDQLPDADGLIADLGEAGLLEERR